MLLSFLSSDDPGWADARPRRRDREASETQSDADLLARIQADDHGAFKVLFERYHTSLRVFAASVAGDDEADAVVQDVFVGVWRRRRELVADPSLRAYLFRAARSLSLNAKRGRTRWALRFTDLDDAQHLTESAQTASNDELTAAVVRAVNQISDRRREAFLLRHEHGLSYAEIAAVMQTSRHTVRNQLAQALRSIHDAIPPELLP
ncbi:MAG: sigma-70 family RNA polymerase sigma factor [Bacteroidota bacterium]